MSRPRSAGWLSGRSHTAWTMWNRGSNVSFALCGNLCDVLMSNSRVLEKEDIKGCIAERGAHAPCLRGEGRAPANVRDLAAHKASMIVDVALSDRAERSLRDGAHHSNAATVGRP